MIIEVPHFASLRGEEREIAILRSDDGQSWREHVAPASEDAIHEMLEGHFEGTSNFRLFLSLFTVCSTRWALTPASKLVLDLHTPEGWKAELTYVTRQCTGWEPISWPLDHKSDAQTTTLPNHLVVVVVVVGSSSSSSSSNRDLLFVTFPPSGCIVTGRVCWFAISFVSSLAWRRSHVWLGSGRASDLWSRGRKFDYRRAHCRAT